MTIDRLEDQLKYYDGAAVRAQAWFKRLRAAVFITSGLVPVSALCPSYGRFIAAGLGFLVIVFEGFQQLGQYQQNWLLYRSTAEALKHEKFLYLAKAGAYADVADPHRLLAEKIEALVSQEHARWTTTQEAAKQKEKPKDHPAE